LYLKRIGRKRRENLLVTEKYKSKSIRKLVAREGRHIPSRGRVESGCEKPKHVGWEQRV
jgi:hypothetical protein